MDTDPPQDTTAGQQPGTTAATPKSNAGSSRATSRTAGASPVIKKEPRPLIPSQRPSGQIGRALRAQGGLDHKAFALMAVDNDGVLRTFGAPAYVARNEARIFPPPVRQFFSQLVARHGTTEPSSRPAAMEPGRMSMATTSGEGRTSKTTRKRLSSTAVKIELGVPPTKRRRTATNPRESRSSRVKSELDSEPEDVEVSAGPSYVQLTISDEKAVTELYRSRFMQLQQLGCKAVAKAWIKRIHPRKQTRNPYRGQNERAPDWWPLATTRHTEPDHLLKHERVHLLIWILRVEWVQIDELEAATREAPQPIVREREPLLTEVYKVAKAEKRYKRGELDADATVAVAPSALSLLQNDPRRKGNTRPLDAMDDDEAADSGDEDLWEAANDTFGDTFLTDDKPGAGRTATESRQELANNTAGRYEDQEMGEAKMERTPSLLSTTTRPYTREDLSHPMSGSLVPARFVETTHASTTSSSFALGHPSPHGYLPPRTDTFGVAPETVMYLPRSQSMRPALNSAGLSPWTSMPAFDTNGAGVYDGYLTHPPTVPSQPVGNMRMDGLISPGSDRDVWFAQARAQAQAHAQLRNDMGLITGLDPDTLSHQAQMSTVRPGLVGPPGMSPFVDADMSPYIYESFNSATTGVPSSAPATGTRRSSATIVDYEDIKEERGD
ncbi:MAG: hypothetical protein M1823_000548 [Watsoniomyces obsoletus]|nr:MAG: hypothetical protein M1823_000548 [Watsoniomyces obsoletus]